MTPKMTSCESCPERTPMPDGIRDFCVPGNAVVPEGGFESCIREG
jgi:hypothetical protein